MSDHDREWIIGCIKHDGFIKTDRFDKANHIILDALEKNIDAEIARLSRPTDLISRADAIEAVRKCKVQDIRFGNVTSNMMLVQKAEVIVALLELPSADAESDDLIIKGAQGIQDGLYNIKDGKLFMYKANGGTVRTYPIVSSAEPIERISENTIVVKYADYEDIGRIILTNGDIFCKMFYEDARQNDDSDYDSLVPDEYKTDDAVPKWNCTANFVAEQLERLKDMTDEERWDFFIRFFSPSADIPTEDYSDLPDIPRAYYEKIVGNMAHEINMLKEQLESADAIPHGRLIDADALIEKIDKEMQKPIIDRIPIIDIIAHVESVDAVQGWIPCSERLPSENGQYICTLPFGDNDDNEVYVWALSFHNGRFYDDDDEWGMIFYDDVIAWQPLPEPYGERRET